jgi:hypothetical protein
MKRLSYIAVLLVVAFLSGCASVPMASLEEDAKAKNFTVDAEKANIYLYRNESFGGAIGMPVALDGRMAGKTGPNTYFLWAVEPGSHEVTSLTENTARISIDAKPGKNYYVWQEVKMGMWTARSQLHEVPEEQGQKGVLECKRVTSEI